MHSVRPIVLLVVTCALTGCRVFEDVQGDESATEKNNLPPITAAPNSIELEIGHIRRLADDPLVNDRLWNDVNQVVVGDDETSWRQIRNNGFRVGVAATQPPDSLVDLLKPDAARSRPAFTPQQSNLQAVVVRDGTPTEVTASPFFAHCRIEFPGEGETRFREFELAQGKYQVTAHKTQEGWVELDFVPVISHADEKTRPTAVAAGTFALQHGKKQKILHTNRFKLRVMVGEWVVIGGNPQKPGTLGHQFYFGSESDDAQLQEYRRRTQEQTGEETAPTPEPLDDERFQRLLVIRVANIKEASVVR